MVEFAPDGWSSDDPAKTAWLKIGSGRSNPWPIIPAAIRLWLQQQCELIEFRGIVPECSEWKTEAGITCRLGLAPFDRIHPIFICTYTRGLERSTAPTPRAERL